MKNDKSLIGFIERIIPPDGYYTAICVEYRTISKTYRAILNAAFSTEPRPWPDDDMVEIILLRHNRAHIYIFDGSVSELIPKEEAFRLVNDAEISQYGTMEDIGKPLMEMIISKSMEKGQANEG